ncbi:unnamed protein product [Chrysoparadoxa australica]
MTTDSLSCYCYCYCYMPPSRLIKAYCYLWHRGALTISSTPAHGGDQTRYSTQDFQEIDERAKDEVESLLSSFEVSERVARSLVLFQTWTERRKTLTPIGLFPHDTMRRSLEFSKAYKPGSKFNLQDMSPHAYQLAAENVMGKLTFTEMKVEKPASDKKYIDFSKMNFKVRISKKSDKAPLAAWRPPKTGLEPAQEAAPDPEELDLIADAAVSMLSDAKYKGYTAAEIAEEMKRPLKEVEAALEYLEKGAQVKQVLGFKRRVYVATEHSDLWLTTPCQLKPTHGPSKGKSASSSSKSKGKDVEPVLLRNKPVISRSWVNINGETTVVLLKNLKRLIIQRLLVYPGSSLNGLSEEVTVCLPSEIECLLDELIQAGCVTKREAPRVPGSRAERSLGTNYQGIHWIH